MQILLRLFKALTFFPMLIVLTLLFIVVDIPCWIFTGKHPTEDFSERCINFYLNNK